jgi:uncharacterized protein with FMN-binding domain
MNLPAHKKMLSAAAAASVMLLTAACGGGGDSPSASSTTTTPSGTATDGGSTSTTGTYKDGDYDAKASYPNPAGSSDVEVAVTLKGGKISAVTVTPEAENSTSKQFQTMFAGGIAGEVVGKSIDAINVTKVAGSSLTQLGFNKAIDQIKADAKA